MNVRISKLPIDEICESYKAGVKLASIAAEHHVSETYIAQIARRFGLPPRRAGRPRKEPQQP